MSVHWKSLDTPGKIEAVKAVWEPKMTASEIASRFVDVSRNSIIGLFYRYPGHLAPCALTTTRKWKANVVTKPRERKAKPPKPKREKIKQTGVVHFKPPMRPEPIHIWDDGTPTVGQPIASLAAHKCRWPVNNAKPDELHLFCGLPSEGSYCAHHKARSVYTGEG